MAAPITVIPPGTYPAATYNIPDTAIPSGIVQGVLALDTSNYDTDTILKLGAAVQLSTDSGATWSDWVAVTWAAPNGLDKNTGLPVHTTTLYFNLPGPAPAGSLWHVRGTATVSGESYVAALAGTLTLN
jgi:hypothetical protein